MIEDKEHWTDEVFASMQGSERIQPPADLLAKIQNKIADSGNKVVPLYQFKFVAVAAVLVVVVNVTSAIYYSKNKAETKVAQVQNQSLISTFQIYK